MPSKIDLRQTIIDWDNKHPVDLWYRRKYNIPFGSKKHLKASFLFMCFEFVEFVELQKNQYAKVESEEQDFYKDDSIPNELKPLKEVVKMSKKEIDLDFDDLDLDEFNK